MSDHDQDAELRRHRIVRLLRTRGRPAHRRHLNQLDKPSSPFGFMSKVAKTATDHLHD